MVIDTPHTTVGNLDDSFPRRALLRYLRRRLLELRAVFLSDAVACQRFCEGNSCAVRAQLRWYAGHSTLRTA